MSDRVNRLVVVGALLIAGVALFIAARSGDSGVPEQRNVAAVERLIPDRGALEVRQVTVGVDLAPGYTGLLTVNGVRIPEDQLDIVLPLNQVFFTPGEAKAIEVFEAGDVCVVADFWQLGLDPSTGSSVQWCFQVA